MFSSQLIAVRSVAKGMNGNFAVTALAQYPARVGTLVTKQAIMGALPDIDYKEGYALNGILLTSTDKLFYFAPFPRAPGNMSEMYTVPKEQVLTFRSPIVFWDLHNN